MNIKELIEGVSTEIQAAKESLAKRGIHIEVSDIVVDLETPWNQEEMPPPDYIRRFTINSSRPVDPKAN